LQHLCFQLHHPPVDLRFDLDKRRFGMRSPPRFDVGQNLFTLLYPAFFVQVFFHGLLSLKLDLAYHLSFSLYISLQKFRAHP